MPKRIVSMLVYRIVILSEMNLMTLFSGKKRKFCHSGENPLNNINFNAIIFLVSCL
jgi:hypothetical protein